MRTIYRTHFQLRPGGENPPTLEALIDLCREWITTRSGLTLPVDLDFKQPSDRLKVGPSRFLEIRAYEGIHGRANGFRLEMPDDEPGVSWVTETVIHKDELDGLWFSCALLVGRQDTVLSPVFRPANRPRIVSDVLHRFPGRGMLPLTHSGVSCSAEETETLLRVLQSPERLHPIVFISRDSRGGRPRRNWSRCRTPCRLGSRHPCRRS